MSEFTKGQEVWVRGKVADPQASCYGNLEIEFLQADGTYAWEYVDPATIRPAPPAPASEINAMEREMVEACLAMDEGARNMDADKYLKSFDRYGKALDALREARAAIARAKGGQP